VPSSQQVGKTSADVSFARPQAAQLSSYYTLTEAALASIIILLFSATERPEASRYSNVLQTLDAGEVRRPAWLVQLVCIVMILLSAGQLSTTESVTKQRCGRDALACLLLHGTISK
jgi:hypothetical protein